jgi:hypothetical protein
MRATELPTVPKPRRATFNGFGDEEVSLRAAGASWVKGFK